MDVVRNPSSRRTKFADIWCVIRPPILRGLPGAPRGRARCTFFWVFNNSPSRDSRNPPRTTAVYPHTVGVWWVYGGYTGWYMGGLSQASQSLKFVGYVVSSDVTRELPEVFSGGLPGAPEIFRAGPGRRAPRAPRARGNFGSSGSHGRSVCVGDLGEYYTT